MNTSFRWLQLPEFWVSLQGAFAPCFAKVASSAIALTGSIGLSGGRSMFYLANVVPISSASQSGTFTSVPSPPTPRVVNQGSGLIKKPLRALKKRCLRKTHYLVENWNSLRLS